ncbi:MAG: hypothetical protein KDC80_09490, partial [Saprospiraceae bacterium]|nr:hypothetical protein [Saprospiraceae bacterium]
DFDPTSGTVNLSSTGSNDIYVADYTYSALSVCDLMISNVASTDETFAGNNDGTITITASCTSCTSIQYSIDNGMNFSPMSSFTGLTPGMYHVLVRNSGDPCCIQDGGDITILTGPTCIDPQGTLSVDLNQICPGGQVNLVFTATAGQEPFALTVNGTVYMNVMSGVPFATLVEGVDFNGDTDFTLTQIMESMGCISNVPQTVSVVVSALSQSNLSCRNLNISVLADGSAAFNLDELVTYGACSAPLNLKITSPSGAIVLNATALTPGSDVIIANACSFGQQQLAVTVSYASGLSCESKISFKQGIPPTIPGRSKDIYCFDALAESGNIDGKTPSVQVPCGPEISMTFVADWLKDYECTTATNANTPESDTAKVIYREYEVFYKDARYVTFDTLVVFRLPAIIAGFSGENTYCAENDTVYCGEGFAGPFMIIPERCDPALFGQDQDGDGVPCDTIYFLSYDTAAGKWVTNDLPAKCGLTMHLDQWAFGDACNRQYKLTLELKQNCYGRETGSICGMATADNAFEYVSPNPFTGLGEPLYLRCEFWVTDLDTVPPLAICKGDPFFGPWRGIDKWTFNTIRDFDFLHEEDFLGGLVAGLPSFDDIVIPDELTMLDTSRAPYSMCYESEKIIENPDIYLGLNTGFMVAESDMEFTFDWDFLLGEFDAQNSIVGVPGAIGLIGYGINGTFYKLVEGVEEPLLDQFAPYQAFLDGVMGELEVDHELCNLNISLFLEDSWGSTTIRLKEGDVLTLFGIWVSNSDAKIQFSGENLISTNTHECSAHAYVPPLIVKEDWSGVKQVKASIEGIGTVILSYDVTQRCYVSHEQLKLPYREDPYQVVYEVYDSCHNVGYEYCYLKVKDRTRPVAVSDKGVTVSLSDKKVWVDATVFDEGSYDNCGVNLLLARRKDWNEACVDLCYNVSPEAACDPKSQTDYESAVIPIWTDGHDTLWCLELEDDKHCDPVEAHYAKQMQWFCEDDLPCGELLYNGWVYDLIKYATLNCRENHYLDNTAFHALIEKALKYPDADPNDSLDYLIEGKFKCSPSRANAECILPFTFGRFPLLEFLLAGPSIPIQMMTAMSTMQTMYLPVEHSFCGYNDAELNYHLDRWSQIGGGWSDAVPFSCEDACGPVTVEILVMDYWCNWNKAWTNVWVEDKTPITVAKDVVDGTITCKVYKDNDYTYPGEEHPVSIEYIIEQAKNGEQDAYAALDGIFGGYCKAWVDPYGNFVDIDGYEIDCDIPFYDSVCYCTSYYEQV